MVTDLVADRYILGTPKRISREAPVLILRYEEERTVPGGGGNAVMNVATLGGRPLAVGAVGDDDSGRRLLEIFAANGIVTDGIQVVEGYRTPTKTRILGGGPHSIKQQVVRYDMEDRLPSRAQVRRACLEALESHAGEGRVAVLSDYGYGSVLPDLVPEVRRAVSPGGRILCDSRYRLAEFRGIDGATPNEEEALALLGGDPAADLERDGARLAERMGLAFLLITRGSLGMVLFGDGARGRIPVHGTAEVADVTGAGDTVIGAFSLAIAAGASPLEAALVANYAGGVVVGKAGTAVVTPEELDEAIASDPAPLEEMTWERS